MINKTLQFTIFLLLSCVHSLFAQLGTEELAYKQFKSGNYETALPIFSDLRALYPEDPSINFHWAVCMIENEQYQKEVLQTLKQVSETNTYDRLNYYLAISYHANNEFANAIEFYDLFDQEAKKKVKKELQFDEKRDACENYENIFVTTETAEPKYTDIVTTDEILDQKTSERLQEAKVTDHTSVKDQPVVAPVAAVPVSKKIIDESEIKEPSPELSRLKLFKIPEDLSDTLIDVNITSNVQFKHISQFKSKEAQIEFVEAWILEAETHEKTLNADQLRLQYRSTDDDVQKSEIANKVFIIEETVLKNRKRSKEKYLTAIRTEAELWNQLTSNELIQLNKENQSFIEKHTPKPIEPEVVEVVIQQEELIIAKPIVETPAAPQLRYKVQIGAYSKGLPGYIETLFGKISTFRTIDSYTDNKGIVVYTVGNLENLSDAKALQKQIRTEGVEGAFVVPYENGKRITMSRAREIEQNK